MIPPWQGGISFGQYCTAHEMASDPYLQEYSTQWMEEIIHCSDGHAGERRAFFCRRDI